jgi:hypothetical protein
LTYKQSFNIIKVSLNYGRLKMTINEMRSKVCALGNRLVVEIGNRSVAFEKAWVIVKAGAIEIAVRGVSFGTRQEALSRLAKYNPNDIHTLIVPEPENTFDSNALAVMVMIQGGRGVYRLGYVSREMTGIVCAIRELHPTIRVVSGNIIGARLRLLV